jgi:putative tricarboxylic transport membrane protein
MKTDPASIPVGVGPTLGNDDHIQFLTLAQMFNVNPKTVKFVVFPQTAAEQIPALLGGHIKAITISLAETLEQVKAGKLRLLGVSSPERLPSIPDVPTWKEQGLDFVFPHWRGLIAAPGLTKDQLKYWDTVIGKMVQTETWKKLLKNLDWDSFYQNAADHKAFLAESYKSQDKLLTSVGLKK